MRTIFISYKSTFLTNTRASSS
uniref:Uncharacterized protein n=1 Tax=Rhizophora mucronata TaxID=61149 RepID=A0A2P2NI79_RHIMU